MKSMTVTDAATEVGLKPAQVSTFIFKKVITPEIHQSKGSGDHSLLSNRNVKELGLAAKLQSVGVKREAIKAILDLLSKSDWWDSDGYVVVKQNREWFVTNNPFSPTNVGLLKKEPVSILIKL